MPRPGLTPTGIKLINKAVDELFDRLHQRVRGDKDWTGGKKLRIAYKKDHTLQGLFEAASREEGVTPHMDVLKPLLNIAGSYLDAVREKTKAKVVQGVQSFLQEAATKGVATDVETVLGGQLADVWKETTSDIKRLVETESTVVRNTGLMDGILRTNAMLGIDDPTVFFVIVRDGNACGECMRLHVMPDGVTPRVWKMSEVGSGYHKKGQDNPKIGGLHPHCRCQLTTLMPGFGFGADGRVTYIKPGHDEYAKQH